MDLYPPALGTIPFGYWASRVLSPSSKAREALGSTHKVTHTVENWYKINIKGE